MLTPVDIQQKKFHVGLGYDKKDVNTFFDNVSESYESLYRSNAELKEKVSILNDTLQNYRSKESHLEKSLKRAEKDTEETISNATKEAKEILRDAKIQANNIVSDAEKRLDDLNDEIAILEAKYTAYKSNFCSLIKKQFEFLGEQDFDPSSMIDDRAWVMLGGEQNSQSSASSDGFGAYTGDPQMRDESTLGGFGSGDVSSTSAVYTQSLSAGENFVDPFKPKDQKDYNPFDSNSKNAEEKKSSLKVANSAEDRKKMKRATVGSSEAAAAVQKAREAAAQGSRTVKPEPSPEPKPEPAPEPRREARPEPERKPEPVASNTEPERKPEPAASNTEPERKPEPAASNTEPERKPGPDIDEIPTILSHLTDSKDDSHTEDETESIEGEVEAKKNNGPALIGEGEDDTETDDDGFEFI